MPIQNANLNLHITGANTNSNSNMIVKHTTFNLTIQNSNLSILCNPSHLYIYIGIETKNLCITLATSRTVSWSIVIVSYIFGCCYALLSIFGGAMNQLIIKGPWHRVQRKPPCRRFDNVPRERNIVLPLHTTVCHSSFPLYRNSR